MTPFKTLSVVTAILGTITVASAQNTGPGMSGTTTSPTQCWDVSSNTVQNRAPGSDMTGAKSGATTGSTAGSATPGTVTPSAPGTVAPGTAGTSGGSSVGGMAQQRPPNMPNC